MFHLWTACNYFMMYPIRSRVDRIGYSDPTSNPGGLISGEHYKRSPTGSRCRLSGGHRRSALRRMSTASSIHHFRRGPPKPSFYAGFKSPSFSEETSLRVCESGRAAAAPVGRSLAASRATTLRAARQMGTYFWAKQFQMSTHVDPFRTKFCVQM